MSTDQIEFKSLDDFEFLSKNKILGEGAFSEVLQVRHKLTNKKYAMKKINLNELSQAD